MEMIVRTVRGDRKENMVRRVIEADRRRGRVMNLDAAEMNDLIMTLTLNLIKQADKKTSWRKMTTVLIWRNRACRQLRCRNWEW